MLMPGRTYTATNGYRYGFNGKENDNEVKGEGNQQDYGMRIYDPRLGKFLSTDPLDKKFPYWTPYQFSGNSPVRFVDLDGAEIFDPFIRLFTTDAVVTITTKPTSAKAKVYGALLGVGGSAQGVVQSAVNIVQHPIQSAKGLLKMATNSPTENAVDYAMNLIHYADLPEPVLDYAVGGHLFGDFAMMLSSFKGPIKSSGIKLSAELSADTKVAGFNLPKKIPGSNMPLKVSPMTVTEMANGCEAMAARVQKTIGGEFLQITPAQGNFLGPVKYKGGTINGWSHHVAVIKEGVVYDGMTGSAGMALEKYKTMFEHSDAIKFEQVKDVTVK